MPLKNLPNNIEAEESVLGACFLSKEAPQKAKESLQPDSHKAASLSASVKSCFMRSSAPVLR